MSALRALAARIARINCDNRHACTFGFVLQKRPQLSESPIVQCRALAAPGRYPVADVRQLFDSNSASGALRLLHKFFRDTVVGVLLKTTLSARYFFELAFCRACALSLKVSATMCVCAALFLHAFAAVAFPIAVECEVNYAQVNTQHIFAFARWGHVDVAHAGDIPFTAHEHQIDLTLAVLEELALPFSADVFDALPSTQQPDGDFRIIAEAKDAVIIWLCGCWAICTLPFSFSSVCVSSNNFTDTAHGQLGREPVTFPEVSIHCLVEFWLAKCLIGKRTQTYFITCVITGFERLLERDKLYLCGSQSDVGNELHTSIIDYIRQKVNTNPQARAAIPLPAKAGSILAVII
jgi:hypothetical protein